MGLILCNLFLLFPLLQISSEAWSFFQAVPGKVFFKIQVAFKFSAEFTTVLCTWRDSTGSCLCVCPLGAFCSFWDISVFVMLAEWLVATCFTFPLVLTNFWISSFMMHLLHGLGDCWNCPAILLVV
jgi:hypothetical protein